MTAARTPGIRVIVLLLTHSGLSASDPPARGIRPPKIRNLAQYASPLCGTGRDGNTYPGATVPFGMIQWSPDAGSGQVRGGYNYRDSTIWAFSLNHLSGAGCYYAGNFGFMTLPSQAHIAPPAVQDPAAGAPDYGGVVLLRSSGVPGQ